uniref:Uncharacterized protein n=1 Tax=Anguilla anguilla TaxID=7936 RepID=A0A0E9W0I1_ANGAN
MLLVSCNVLSMLFCKCLRGVLLYIQVIRPLCFRSDCFLTSLINCYNDELNKDFCDLKC